jgi:hypothetical protein
MRSRFPHHVGTAEAFYAMQPERSWLFYPLLPANLGGCSEDYED